ncbi:ARF GTPase-activating protein GIT2 [Halotydeus destructor]|nr:ARF GTPase-activating protein GIT2 [Halotydeus destructor]
MSRQLKSTRAPEVCADCSALEPSWTSINRGVYICDECCSVHRSLGRHISQVKSLMRDNWITSQLSMVRELQATGANSIWEHSLLDPTGFAAITHVMKISKKKPSYKDAVHPTKADFIRTKYEMLAFINRSSEDSDLSDQLHSSVRTPNLKTSLRLLAAGADVNYVHPEKGNCPIHVAANSGQLLQIELLLVYGADSRSSDTKGKQAIDYAKVHNHIDIMERLNAAPYELTDRLTKYVCGKTAEHETGQHFLVPEMKDSPETEHLSTAAKSGLQALPNNVFEELTKDVYDEVDRRETEECWALLQPKVTGPSSQFLVPFLPVNKLFSSTRNQGRQKLARYTNREFTTLIVDIISEARRRQLGLPLHEATCRISIAKSMTSNKIKESLVDDSDSEPLYDEVPSSGDSDDNDDQSVAINFKKMTATAISRTAQNSLTHGEYDALQQQLVRSDNLVRELVTSNKDMKHEISRLQVMVQTLIDENGQLRTLVIPKSATPVPSHRNETPPVVLPRQPKPKVLSRPQSMFERGAVASRSLLQPPRDDSGLGTTSSHNPKESVEYAVSSILSSHSETNSLSGLVDSPTYDELEFVQTMVDTGVNCLPGKDEVYRKTETITRRIQELLALAQDNKHEAYLPCAEKIGYSVDSMIQIFPETIQSFTTGSHEEKVYIALGHLQASAVQLHTECSRHVSATSRPGSANNTPTRSPFREATASRDITQQVIQSAYDIAKAAKTLVTMFQ